MGAVEDFGKKLEGGWNDITGKSTEDAANQGYAEQAAATEKASGLIQDSTNKGLGLSKTALEKALTAGQTGFDAATAAQTQGYDTSKGALNTAAKNAIGNYQTGYTDASGKLIAGATEAAKNIAPWMQAGTTALQRQQDLMGLGVNGAEGQLTALQASPGYQFGVDQGNRALAASTAARGGMGSGKAMQAAQEFGQNYATGQLDKQIAQLSDLQKQGQSSGQTLGGYDMSTGQNLANLGMTTASNIAGTNKDLGAGLSSLSTNYANNMSGLNTGQGQNIGNLELGTAANQSNLLGNNAQSLSGLYTGLSNAYAASKMAGANAKSKGSTGIFDKLLSDSRLKKDIVQIGWHRIGIPLYVWNYIWGEPSYGVMAQELKEVMPEAVVVAESGYYMVDYGMIGGRI